jgi:hypothetical protein
MPIHWGVLQRERIMTAVARTASTSASPTSKAMSAAGLRAFFRIAGLWGLNTEEQRVLLGEPGRSTLFKWKSAPEAADLKRDTLERLSYILGIYKSLQILLPDPAAADAWIKKTNTAPGFGGKSALNRMLGGNIGDLVVVRQYLEQ